MASAVGKIRVDAPQRLITPPPSQLLTPPSLKEELPEHLYAAIEAWRLALSVLESGDVRYALSQAWLACERVAIWLEGESKIAPPEPGRSTHSQRAVNLARYLGGPPEPLLALSGQRKLDSYGSKYPGGELSSVTSSKAERAAHLAERVLRTVAWRNDLLSPQQRKRLQYFLDHPMPGPINEGLIELVESNVMFGLHGTGVDDHLNFLLRRYRYPHSAGERLRAGIVSVLAAHSAMNRGEYPLVLDWVDHALRLFESAREPYRVSHLFRIKSIAYRHLGDVRQAWSTLQEGLRAAGPDPGCVHLMRNHECLLLGREGQTTQALNLAKLLVRQAGEWKSEDTMKRRLVSVGIIQTMRKEYDASEEVLLASLDGRPDHHVTVRVFTYLALMDTYERSGQLDKARTAAMLAQAIANQHHLRWHSGRAAVTLARLDGRTPPKLKGGYDVF